MAKSTLSRPSRQSAKPDKPYPEYPLFPHASGRWAKKIKGRLHYFGRWAHNRNGKLERVPGDGWQDALDEYQRTVDDLMARRNPRPKDEADGATLRDLCNAFLRSKKDKLDTGEILPTTWSLAQGNPSLNSRLGP